MIGCIFDTLSKIIGIRIKSLRKKFPRKTNLNTVEREPVPTRVLNTNASEASYKPIQRSYRKTKLIFFFGGILVGGILSGNPNMQPFQYQANDLWGLCSGVTDVVA